MNKIIKDQMQDKFELKVKTKKDKNIIVPIEIYQDKSNYKIEIDSKLLKEISPKDLEIQLHQYYKNKFLTLDIPCTPLETHKKIIKFKDQDQSLLHNEYLSCFPEGYTKLAVELPEGFRRALGINWTIKKIGLSKEAKEILYRGKKVSIPINILTQGSNYSFEQGECIYNTKKAYLIWSEALKYISFCIDVKFAKPAIPINKEQIFILEAELKGEINENGIFNKLIDKFSDNNFPLTNSSILEKIDSQRWIISDKENPIFIDTPENLREFVMVYKSNKDHKKRYIQVYKTVKRDPGFIKYDILRINKNRTSLEYSESLSSTQDQFVEFLSI